MPLQLGIDGFTFEDLDSPEGLARLHARFLAALAGADAGLAARFDEWCRGSAALTHPQESELLVRVAEHVSRFLGRLFGIEAPLAALRSRLTGELALFEFKREFVNRRVFRRGATGRPRPEELPELDRRVQLLFALGFPAAPDDAERALAETTVTLLQLERHFSGAPAPSQSAPAPADLPQRWERLRRALLSTAEGKAAFGNTLVGDDLAQVRGLLALIDRWIWGRAAVDPAFRSRATLRQPVKPLRFDALVEVEKVPGLPGAFEGPAARLRRRDGFKLTDPALRRAAGDERGRLLRALPRARARTAAPTASRRRPPALPTPTRRTRSACRSPAARSTSASPRCTCCSRAATRSPRWRW